MMLWGSQWLPIIRLSKSKGIFQCVWQCNPLASIVISNLTWVWQPGVAEVTLKQPNSRIEKGQNAGSAPGLASSRWSPGAKWFSHFWCAYSQVSVRMRAYSPPALPSSEALFHQGIACCLCFLHSRPGVSKPLAVLHNIFELHEIPDSLPRRGGPREWRAYF